MRTNLECMEKVGVRKVKAKLSSYLRRVKRGETILVTERGRTVAELRPHADGEQDGADRLEAALDRLVSQGKLKRARSARGSAMDVWRGWKGLGGRRLDSLELLRRTRGEDVAWPESRTSKRAR